MRVRVPSPAPDRRRQAEKFIHQEISSRFLWARRLRGTRRRGWREVLTDGFPSGQREQTVNLSAKPSEVRILPPPPFSAASSGNSSVARASAFQAEGRGFESRFPLHLTAATAPMMGRRAARFQGLGRVSSTKSPCGRQTFELDSGFPMLLNSAAHVIPRRLSGSGSRPGGVRLSTPGR